MNVLEFVRKQKKERRFFLKCPYDVCGKAINDQVTIANLDFMPYRKYIKGFDPMY